jgi:hypothetical protein
MMPQRLNNAYLAVLIVTQKCSMRAQGREPLEKRDIGHLFLLSVARDLCHVLLGGSQLHSRRKGSAFGPSLSFFPFDGFLFLFRLKKMGGGDI